MTVSNPVPGATITLMLTAKSGSTFAPAGPTTTITLVAGVTEYAFCLDIPTTVDERSETNTLRIEVQSYTGDLTNPTEKSQSFHCYDDRRVRGR